MRLRWGLGLAGWGDYDGLVCFLGVDASSIVEIDGYPTISNSIVVVVAVDIHLKTLP